MDNASYPTHTLVAIASSLYAAFSKQQAEGLRFSNGGLVRRVGFRDSLVIDSSTRIELLQKRFRDLTPGNVL